MAAREQPRSGVGREHWAPDRRAWHELRQAQVDLQGFAERGASARVPEDADEEPGVPADFQPESEFLQEPLPPMDQAQPSALPAPLERVRPR
eukprot:12902486-Alexandrium_andersonii.AAC.1